MISILGKIYLSGLVVLVGAITINSLAKLIKLPTWYDFLNQPKLGFINILWLFIIYPLFLGLLVFLARKYF